ncbi:MAG: YeeE/YedE family protein [Alphaproteobacteria bacterium]
MTTLPAAETVRPMQTSVAVTGLLALAAGALLLGSDGWRYGALFAIGGLLGMSLYHASFGFTSAYRNAILHRDIAGITAQLLMIGLAMLLFAPFLAAGEAFGRPVGGAVAPAGLRVAIGSFIFGLGMQLGGGCGSGTLYTVGGGSTRMLVTLIAFCAGAFAGSLDALQLPPLPSLGAVSLGKMLGWPAAIALQAALLAALWLGFRAWAGDRPQRPIWGEGLSARTLLAGPWPLLFSAGLLAVLNLLTLLVAGHPWTVTWAFTLWGAEAAQALGWSPAGTRFWNGGFPGRALEGSLFRDNITLMNLGIMLGALAAAGLAGRFAPIARIPFRSLLAAILGGLLMGYGARLAFGCNIGAFFSGAASFSLHAWIWILFAFAGTWIGVRLRPWFGFVD